MKWIEDNHFFFSTHKELHMYLWKHWVSGDHKEINGFEKIIIIVIFKSKENSGKQEYVIFVCSFAVWIKNNYDEKNQSVISSKKAKGKKIYMDKFG